MALPLPSPDETPDARPAARSLLLTQDFPPDRGGLARLYGELSKRLHGVEVSTVASHGPCGPHDPRVHRMSFTLSQAHRPANIYRWIRWAGQHVALRETAVVHVANIRSAGYVAAWLRRNAGVPYLVYVHGKDLMKERRKSAASVLVRMGTREILGNAGAIVAISSATAELTRDLLCAVGRPDALQRIRIVHPGTDPIRFCRTASGVEAWRRSVAIGGPLLLAVARLVERKGIDTVIESLPTILARYPNATFAVVGTGPDQARLDALARSVRVADNVRFLGDIDDDALPACYAAADVFVLPVRTIPADDEVEGFGIVYLEAAAAGVPCVASRAGGVADAVNDEVTGLLVPPSDPRAVAHAVLRLLDDPALHARLAHNGRRAVEAHFNWERAAREVTAIGHELSEAAGRR